MLLSLILLVKLLAIYVSSLQCTFEIVENNMANRYHRNARFCSDTLDYVGS